MFKASVVVQIMNNITCLFLMAIIFIACIQWLEVPLLGHLPLRIHVGQTRSCHPDETLVGGTGRRLRFRTTDGTL